LVRCNCYVTLAKGAACLDAAPHFVGNKTVSATKRRVDPQSGRLVALACPATH